MFIPVTSGSLARCRNHFAIDELHYWFSPSTSRVFSVWHAECFQQSHKNLLLQRSMMTTEHFLLLRTPGLSWLPAKRAQGPAFSRGHSPACSHLLYRVPSWIGAESAMQTDRSYAHILQKKKSCENMSVSCRVWSTNHSTSSSGS